MLSKIKSISLTGLEGNLVEVQTDIRNGIPEFEIVGLPDIRVKESKKRIESAIMLQRMLSKAMETLKLNFQARKF